MRTEHLSKILKQPSVAIDGRHTYTNKLTGDFYTGCTTISEAWAKDFLSAWYAKEAVKFLGWFDESDPEKVKKLKLAFARKFRAVKKMTGKEYFDLLLEAKGAAKRIGDEAKENGDLAHKWIQSAIAIKIDPKQKLIPRPKSKEAENAINAFIGWAKGRDIKWLACEEILSNDEFKIAGTLDALAVIDGITYIVDFKTSKQMSPSYLLQCAGYDLMLREMGLQVSGYIVLRIPKDGTDAETLTITDKNDMEFFRDTFLRQREAHKFYLLMENKYKDATTKKMKVDAK